MTTGTIKENTRIREDMSEVEIKRLADAIIAEWLDSQSDNGAIWQKSFHALEVLKSEAGEEGLKEAYKIARSRYEAMMQPRLNS
jgi:hypothetical protein